MQHRIWEWSFTPNGLENRKPILAIKHSLNSLCRRRRSREEEARRDRTKCQSQMLRRKLAALSPFAKSSYNPTHPGSVLRRPNHANFFSSSVATEQAARGSDGAAGTKKKRTLGKRFFQIGLISLTGGVALSALNDLAIFHGCSSKAIERASQNQQVIEALGLPITRGPWYDATLAVGHRRHSVSCTFPVSGPQGTGIFQLKAIRHGEERTFSFLWHHDWDILVMDAVLHIHSNDEKQQTMRINITENFPSPTPVAECKSCLSPEYSTPKK